MSHTIGLLVWCTVQRLSVWCPLLDYVMLGRCTAVTQRSSAPRNCKHNTSCCPCINPIIVVDFKRWAFGFYPTTVQVHPNMPTSQLKDMLYVAVSTDEEGDHHHLILHICTSAGTAAHELGEESVLRLLQHSAKMATWSTLWTLCKGLPAVQTLSSTAAGDLLLSAVCVCESYIGKPIGTRAVPQFTTGVAKPLTQIEPGKN